MKICSTLITFGLLFSSHVSEANEYGRLEPEIFFKVGPKFDGDALVDINAAETYVICGKVPHGKKVAVYNPQESPSAVDAKHAVCTQFPAVVNRPQTTATGKLFVDDIQLYGMAGRVGLVVVDKTTDFLDHAGDFGDRSSGRFGMNLNAQGLSNVSDVLFESFPRKLSYHAQHTKYIYVNLLTIGSCNAPPVAVVPIEQNAQSLWSVLADGIAVGNLNVSRKLPVLFSTTIPDIVLPKQYFNVWTKGLDVKAGEHGLELDCDSVDKVPPLELTFNGVPISIVGEHVMEIRENDVCIFRVKPATDSTIVLGLPFYDAASTCWDADKQQVQLTPMLPDAFAKYGKLLQTTGRITEKVKDGLRIFTAKRRN